MIRFPNGAKDTMSLIIPMAQKGVVGPCEANVGTLEKFDSGALLQWACANSRSRLQLVLHVRRVCPHAVKSWISMEHLIFQCEDS